MTIRADDCQRLDAVLRSALATAHSRAQHEGERPWVVALGFTIADHGAAPLARTRTPSPPTLPIAPGDTVGAHFWFHEKEKP